MMCSWWPGMDVLDDKTRPIVFADTMVNLEPDAKTIDRNHLADRPCCKEIQYRTQDRVIIFLKLWFCKGAVPLKMREAISILHHDHPDLLVDGDIQGNFALNVDLVREAFPFSKLVDGPANILIFPNLAASHIAFKLLKEGR